MKYVIVAIVCFVLGFILGGGISFKVISDWSAESMYENMQEMTNEQLEILKNESGSIYEEKKQELIDKLNEEKEKMLEEAKAKIKETINEKIDDIFSFGAKEDEEAESGSGNLLTGGLE